MGHTGPPGDRAVSGTDTVDVLAFGSHPDDVELGCGGTLVVLAAKGRTFGICDLTHGEMGTRGTPETRASEARRASEILGARFRETLDLGDGSLRTDRAAELDVIDVVRRRRPRIVFAPWREDRHPDHGRGSRLVTDAAWYAGLRALTTGAPAHRPQRVVYYPSSYDFGRLPSFLIDVSAVFETKRAAIRAYESQFFSSAPRGPETFLSSRRFLEGIEARARAFGRMANVEYAEGFVSSVPPRLEDVVAAFEGYEP
jgi:bacillithiol biosynthesis deacetylase BshB1